MDVEIRYEQPGDEEAIASSHRDLRAGRGGAAGKADQAVLDFLDRYLKGAVGKG
jgi:hypothetical protein